MSAFFLCTSVFGQIFGELLPGSSALVYDEKSGVHKLLDGANFVYQGNTMYCDSAYYFEKNKTIRAYGNVHIRKSDNVNLFCDSLCYYSSNGIATLWGKVRATDSQYRLTTDSMTYNTRNEQGIYRNGGKIENMMKNEVLTSKVGYFYPNSKNFFFRTNVVYTSDELRMTTDSLRYRYEKSTCYFYGPTCIITEDAFMEGEKGWYNMDTEEGSLMKNAVIEQDTRIIKGDSLLYSPRDQIAEGFCNVYIYDIKDSIAFTGHYAIMNDSMKYSLLTDEAMIIKYQKEDTLHIHADTLYNQNDSLNNRLLTLGYHGVKIFSSRIQGIGDSLSYAKADGYMELYKKPILWSQNGELKGDSMRVYMNDSTIQEARMWGKATAVMEVDSGQYYNQIGGTEMIAYFLKNEIHQAKVIGNAQTIYFPEEEVKNEGEDSLAFSPTDTIPKLETPTDTLSLSDNVPDSLQIEPAIDSLSSKQMVVIKRMGMNRFYASEIKIYFDSGEVVGVTYYEQPDGVFYPMDKINKEEQFIQNFSTNFALRPKSVEDLLKEE
jgi:lipopolysaccharide export system protein LptA